jgi:hypothetical protein
MDQLPDRGRDRGEVVVTERQNAKIAQLKDSSREFGEEIIGEVETQMRLEIGARVKHAGHDLVLLAESFEGGYLVW